VPEHGAVGIDYFSIGLWIALSKSLRKGAGS
jgi:hypothetical protein